MKTKRIVSIALAAAITVSSASFIFANAAATPAPAFNEKDIILRMPVMSDVHLGASANFSSEHFKSALDKYKTYGTLDAMMFAGDFVDYGLEDQVKFFSEQLTAKIDLSKTKLVIAPGNHELYDYSINSNPFTVPQNLVKYLGADKVYQGATKEEISAGNYATKVNGIDLLAVNCWTYSGGVKFRTEDLKWLEEALKKTDSSKPVFIATHPAIKGTNWGSDYGAYWATTDEDMYNIVKQYPNATVFSGHLHFPPTNDKIIWQGDFTTMGTGSVSYASLEDKDEYGAPYLGMGGSEPTDAQTVSNGLLVEVDSKGNTRIKRLDFISGKEIKTPFYIDAPKSDKSHLTRYSKATVNAANTAPSFATNSKVATEIVNGTSLKVTFNAATDNDMIYAYEITMYDVQNNRKIKTRTAYSDFYKKDSASEMAKSVAVTMAKRDLGVFNVNYRNDWRVDVTPIDCFGLKGNTISSDITKGSGADIPDVPIDETPEGNWGYRAYGNFDAYSTGYNLGLGTDFNSWPTPDMATAPKKLPLAKSGNGNTNALTSELTATNGFFDVLFAQGGKGYKMDQEGAKEFWIWVDTTGVTLNDVCFGFRTGNVYGTEYYTEFNSDDTMKAYIQDGTAWKALPFVNGKMTLSNYKGFIRFDAEYFVLNGTTEALFPVDLAAFMFRYGSASAESIGKTYTIDEIGFAGPAIDRPNLKVSQLLDGKIPSPFDVVNKETTMEKTTFVTFMDFQNDLFILDKPISQKDGYDANKYAGTPEKQFGTYFDMTVVNKDINGKSSKALELESFDKEFEGKPNKGLYTELRFSPNKKIGKNPQMLPAGKNIPSGSETHGFLIYVDTTEYMAGSIDCQFIFKEMDCNDDGTPYIVKNEDDEDVPNITFRSLAPGGDYYIEETPGGNFVNGGKIDNSNYINIPADYKGYIKIPFASMNLAWGSSDVNGKFDFQRFQSFSFYYGCYPSRLGPVYFDDLGFYGDTFKNKVPDFILGDATGDNKLDTRDSLAILKHIVELKKLTDDNLLAADYNEDGKVNSLDSLSILKKLVA